MNNTIESSLPAHKIKFRYQLENNPLDALGKKMCFQVIFRAGGRITEFYRDVSTATDLELELSHLVQSESLLEMSPERYIDLGTFHTHPSLKMFKLHLREAIKAVHIPEDGFFLAEEATEQNKDIPWRAERRVDVPNEECTGDIGLFASRDAALEAILVDSQRQGIQDVYWYLVPVKPEPIYSSVEEWVLDEQWSAWCNWGDDDEKILNESPEDREARWNSDGHEKIEISSLTIAPRTKLSTYLAKHTNDHLSTQS